jgi:hypothetical protein
MVNVTPLTALSPGMRPGTHCVGGRVGAKNFTSTEIRSLDRLACSESLYRLSYPAPPIITLHKFINF